jgi:dTMP kinase
MADCIIFLLGFQILTYLANERFALSLLVTLEGVEGSGKTTQIRRLKRYLNRRGIPCVTTREPGGTRIGEKIRRILLDRSHRDIVPMNELFLYEAARAQHIKEVIQPLLRKKVVILCDRFSDASIAYQGHGRGISLRWVEQLNRIATGGIKPHLTFLLDCPSDMGLKRALRRNLRKENKEDRFEREEIQFHNRVRRGYLSLAQRESSRIKVIDTRHGEKMVFQEMRQHIDRLLRRKGY